MANLTSLLSHYDSFAWVPTIKGALSLNLVGLNNNILGDVDRYAIEFKDYNGKHSEHYIVASSLVTVNDTKCGNNYCRTFRYILKGSINVETHQKAHFGVVQIDNDIQKAFENDGVFVGRLAIVAEIKLEPTMLEASLLQKLRELSKLKDDFTRSRDVLADSMDCLNGKRKEMVKTWNTVADLMDQTVNDDKNKRPTYVFDILLTRDGILLVKDVTKDEWLRTYAAPDTADDYKSNIPIHRVFKMAANYVKYLFHTNYHHNSGHDTYLPASNLNCISHDVDGFKRVFRHQMNAFISPISRQKRNGFNDFPIEPNGILQYAKAFVNVCYNNGLIEEKDYKTNISFIDIQTKEIEIMTASQRGIVASVLSQKNMVFLVSGVLAYMVAIIKLLTTFFEFHRHAFFTTIRSLCFGTLSPEESVSLVHQAAGLVVLALSGVTIYYLYFSCKESKRFKPHCTGRSWLMKDSDKITCKISKHYRFYIFVQSIKLGIGQLAGSYLLIGFIILMLVGIAFFAGRLLI